MPALSGPSPCHLHPVTLALSPCLAPSQHPLTRPLSQSQPHTHPLTPPLTTPHPHLTLTLAHPNQVKVCAQAFYILQAHHDYCPDDTLTRDEEVLFRDWESKCANFPVGLTEQSESLHWYCILPLCVLLVLGCLITRAVWRRHQRVLQDRANLRISRDRAHVDLQIHLHQKANGASA